MEIVALSYSVIKWLSTLPATAYPHQLVSESDARIDRMDIDGRVDDDDEKSGIRLADWAAKIAANFEPAFWVPSNPAVLGRGGYYKDTIGKEWVRLRHVPAYLLVRALVGDKSDHIVKVQWRSQL